MAPTASGVPAAAVERLCSLDFFRGLTMFLLIGESTHIYARLVDPGLQGTILSAIGTQFHHHPWNGLRFWDLVQPFFMFIVGVAIPFAVAARERRGDSRRMIAAHVVRRAFVLLLLGWALYCIGPGRITFRFQNVLAQLSVTYLVAFLIMRKPVKAQLGLSFGLIALTELLYRVFPLAGYNEPFVPSRNFGAFIDQMISGELSADHWVSFNAIPTTAHTIWGVLAGLLLMSAIAPKRKIGILAACGAAGLAAGYALTPVSPIIKRICTSSFILVSGGFCLLALALSYGVVDVLKLRRGTKFFAIVGMNSLAIYLFTESGATSWVLRLAKPFTTAAFSWGGTLTAEIATSLAAWALLWSICLWLYKRKILIKI